MTQVDLPQLSLQRYLELVKRRRWQLVPVSLLGLVVGGLIAFFIPRYFVASTLIQHEAVPGELRERTDDPFSAIVASARSTIPQAVGKAMELLKWPEAQIADPHEKAQSVREVQDRLSVDRVNADAAVELFAQLRITYRDRDGSRVAALPNAVFEVWRDRRIGELREAAEDLRRAAQEEERQWSGVRETCLLERQRIERQYRIAPEADLQTKRETFQKREEQRTKRRDDLRDKQQAMALAEEHLASDKERLATMPPRAVPDLLSLGTAAVGNPRLLMWMAALEQRSLELENLVEGTGAWASAKRGYEQAQREIKRLLNPESLDGDGMVPNPEREALRKKILADEDSLKALKKEVGELGTAIEEEDRRLGEAHDGFSLWEVNNDKLETATTFRNQATARATAQGEIVAKLMTRMPVTQEVKATTPPRPTEPNILVVALIGCVLGLGAAIALILLLDFLQGSFKTVEDVERGLTVPVLGGMSHLETDEERVTTQRGRRRASLAAFGFVGLVVVVVTIFYVDPTRLPSVVRDLLAMLLGS